MFKTNNKEGMTHEEIIKFLSAFDKWTEENNKTEHSHPLFVIIITHFIKYFS